MIFRGHINTHFPESLSGITDGHDEIADDHQKKKNDFMRLVGKLTPKIELFCFFEQHPTDFAKIAGLPDVFGLWKTVTPKQVSEFVTRDSAVPTGVPQMGLACTHQELVKFDGVKDERFQLVRDPLRRVVSRAPNVAKNRLNSIRDVDRDVVKEVLRTLDGVSVQMKRKSLAKTISLSSWITKEAEYVDWLVKEVGSETRRKDCLWIRGPEGRGKTSAVLAAVEEMQGIVRASENASLDQAPSLLAYFFCDPTADCNTAEDLVKSLLRQLIDQQDVLASYANRFIKKKGNQSTTSTMSTAKPSIENLLLSLSELLEDKLIGTVYLVVNNLHALPEDSDSTIKLMDYIKSEIRDMNNVDKSRPSVRWLFTSQNNYSIGVALNADTVRQINLEDPKYGSQVQTQLREHAQKKVEALKNDKKYNKALSYFARSLMGKRAQNTQWIDITCVQLAELPSAVSDLQVRSVLEEIPQDLNALLDRAWLSVLGSNYEGVKQIKEMLRALILTYEDPTETELALLTGLAYEDQQKAELRGLVEKCKPLLTFKKTAEGGHRISFMNMVLKSHLEENATKLLGLSEEETKWQHGMLAMRCFSHLVDHFQVSPESVNSDDPGQAEKGTQEAAAHDNAALAAGDTAEKIQTETQTQVQDGSEYASNRNDEAESQSEHLSGDESDCGSDWSESDWSESDWSDTISQNVAQTTESVVEQGTAALGYAVKHWLYHASKANQEIAEDLSLEEDFWKRDSPMRTKWLEEYNNLTHVLDGFDMSTFTGLHVAASIGFAHLVSALLKHGHDEEKNKRDSLANTPLHLAAYHGHVDIVDELLNNDSSIDDGIDNADSTPLSMAAFGGHVPIMKRLIRRGAEVNAIDKEVGSIVNAAILSGKLEAVEILVKHGAHLSTADQTNDHGVLSPIAMAALMSDLEMFNYLVDACSGKLQHNEYQETFIVAASAGRQDILEQLLKHNFERSAFQEAVDAAAGESE
jgi:cell wall-associated NlpC family hydrolase